MLCACTNMSATALSGALGTQVPKENIDASTIRNIEIAANKILVGTSIMDIAHLNCYEKQTEPNQQIGIICNTPLHNLKDISSRQVPTKDFAFQVSLSSKLV